MPEVGELVERLRDHARFYKERPAIDQDKQLPQMAEISERETAAEAAILDAAADALERLTSDCERLRGALDEEQAKPKVPVIRKVKAKSEWFINDRGELDHTVEWVDYDTSPRRTDSGAQAMTKGTPDAIR